MICEKLQECMEGQISGKHLPECRNRNKEVCIESSVGNIMEI